VRRASRLVVTVAGAEGARAVHAAIDRPEDFDARAHPNTLTSDEGVAPDGIPVELAARRDVRAERVVGARVQRFEGMTARITVALALGRATFHVAGDSPRVSRIASGPLLLRLALGGCMAAAVSVGAVAVVIAYVGRHPWFAAEGAWPLLLAALGVGAASTVIAALLASLGARGARTAHTLAAVGAAALAVAVAAVVYATSNPSAAHASARAEHADLDGAEFEADAARRFTSDRAAAEAVLDRVHRRRQAATTDIDELIRLAATPWFDPSKRADAEAFADHEHLARLRAARDLNSIERLAALRYFDDQAALEGRTTLHVAVAEAVESASAPGQQVALQSLRARAVSLAPDLVPQVDRQLALFAIESCRVANDWRCVVDGIANAQRLGAADTAWARAHDEAVTGLRAAGHAAISAVGTVRDAPARAHYIREALSDADLLEALHAPDSALNVTTLTARAEAADAVVRREDEQRRRQADRLAAQAERAAERGRAAERERASRRSCSACTCCDGSCGCCGRGCCSHHGGICG